MEYSIPAPTPRLAIVEEKSPSPFPLCRIHPKGQEQAFFSGNANLSGRYLSIWKTVKEYEKIYMQEKIDRRGEVNPQVFGVDEVSIRKGHTFRIAVSDLEKKDPIWLGGRDRSAENKDAFWTCFGPEKAKKIRLVVMETWEHSLRWQRLKSLEKFNRLAERHWEGFAEFSVTENRKNSLGYVEGLNNKIRVLQRKAYGLRDTEFLVLRVRSGGLPDFFRLVKPSPCGILPHVIWRRPNLF